jgi:lysozyme
MQTSAKGRADIKLHEGEVLKAYLCPANKWTIGVGLTSASGVVKVKPGMQISREESDQLLSLALNRNYEPRVLKAMPKAQQHEFDGGVSFDFNTGAIHKASWVKAFRIHDWVKVEAGLKLWNKGGGKVLPGLVRRREAEYLMIRYGAYASDKTPAKVPANPKAARITLQLSKAELAAVRDGFRKLGFDPGKSTDHVDLSAVRAFQAKHDLTVDGVLGRATLSTLQRALDARAKGKPAAVAAGASGGATAAPSETVVDLTGLPDLGWLPTAALGLTLAYGLWLAWRYRDQVAGAIQSPLPRVAAFLRSF